MSQSFDGWSVTPLQVPDFGATLARAQNMQANRLAMLARRRQLDQQQALQDFFANNGAGFASSDPAKRMNLLAMLAGQPGGATMALPMLTQERENSLIAGALRGEMPGAATPEPQAAAPAALSGTGGGQDLTVSVPSDLDPIIREEAARVGIPYETAVRMIRQESNFDPNARGRAGEIGLMQIMPATARNPGFGMTGVDPASLGDPRANIRFGLEYLSRRGQSLGVRDWNDPSQRARALGAYNGGGDPNYVQNVERWRLAPLEPQQGNPYARQIAALVATGNPRALQIAQALSQIGARETPRMTEVRTNEGVFLVDPTNPERRVRIGGIPETAPRTPERFEQDRALAEAGAARSQTTVNAGDRRTDVLVADAWNEAEQTARDAGRRNVLLRRAEAAFERFQPGMLAERRIWLGQLARELGIRSPGTSEGEVLQQVQRNLELAATPRGQGQITENERALIREAVPVLLRTPEGARAAINLIRQLDDYEMQIARIYRENARRHGGQPDAVSVREDIANFVAQNQPPDVQAVLEPLMNQQPGQAGGVNAEPPPSVPPAPRIGEVRDGYRFRGGNPGDQSSWERVR